jgi:hypothetical protein
MDTPEVYPDVLGDALSYASQRLAQLGSRWSPLRERIDGRVGQ